MFVIKYLQIYMHSICKKLLVIEICNIQCIIEHTVCSHDVLQQTNSESSHICPHSRH